MNTIRCGDLIMFKHDLYGCDIGLVVMEDKKWGGFWVWWPKGVMEEDPSKFIAISDYEWLLTKKLC